MTKYLTSSLRKGLIQLLGSEECSRERAQQQEEPHCVRKSIDNPVALCLQSGRRETLPSWSFLLLRASSEWHHLPSGWDQSRNTLRDTPTDTSLWIPKPVVLTMKTNHHKATPCTLLTMTTGNLVLHTPAVQTIYVGHSLVLVTLWD